MSQPASTGNAYRADAGQPPDSSSPPAAQQLEVAVADMASDLADTTRERNQADNKAIGLLGGTVGALAAELAALVALSSRLGGWGTAALLVSVALLVVSAGVFARAIRPAAVAAAAIVDRRGFSWGHVRHARFSTSAELAGYYLDRAANPGQRAEAFATALLGQSRRVDRKYQLVRRGVDFGALGLLAACAAAVLAALA